MTDKYRRRRFVFVSMILILLAISILMSIPQVEKNIDNNKHTHSSNTQQNIALDELSKLAIKGRAPKTSYSRSQFGDGWAMKNGCDTRNIILNRDLKETSVDSSCHVVKGVLSDPYTGKTVYFSRGSGSSGDVQIDHVVALSDAWQKGARQMSFSARIKLANDPLELLAVSGPANEKKGDGDAATWLPSNKAFRCEYVARQIAVKIKYTLWVTQAEYDAMETVLSKCPNQLLPSP